MLVVLPMKRNFMIQMRSNKFKAIEAMQPLNERDSSCRN
jgi:hypothetical protein